MAVSTAQAAQPQPSVFLSLAFRPFFLAAGLWSALALAIWIGVFITGTALPSRFDPLSWHVHAMLFGFVPAAIAGFMLTAIPNWTGRPPIRGTLLGWLAVLWLAGRIACLFSIYLPLWLGAAIDLAFLLALFTIALREIVAARNWRNLMMPVPIGVLTIANLLMYCELAGFNVPTGLGWHLALAAIIILISAIGGRIIPNFTRNWLMQRGQTALPAAHNWIDGAALGTLHTGLIGWALFPAFRPLDALLLLAAAFNLWRLARWRGFACLAEPLLAILHLGYFWVAAGAALLGASMLMDSVPIAAAIHAFTAGAIGTMVLAVMTRVARGHTGPPLKADSVTPPIYALISAAALTRICAAFASAHMLALLEISAGLWIAAFVLFVGFYGPMLMKPRIQ